MNTSCVIANNAESAPKNLAGSVERQLIARAAKGDEEAFAALFDAHKRRVYSICLRMTGNTAMAEDLTQEAFLQVFRKLNTFRGEAAFSTWLFRIAMNTVLMMFRKLDYRQTSLDEPLELQTSSVPREAGKNDLQLLGVVDRISLARAIDQLPTGYRKIFILHEVEGYEHSEIAELLHCSVGNSKSQLHKAKLKIREALVTGRIMQKRNSPDANCQAIFRRPGRQSKEQVTVRLTDAATLA